MGRPRKEDLVAEETEEPVELGREVVFDTVAVSVFRIGNTDRYQLIKIPMNRETLDTGMPVVRDIEMQYDAVDQFKILAGEELLEKLSRA